MKISPLSIGISALRGPLLAGVPALPVFAFVSAGPQAGAGSTFDVPVGYTLSADTNVDFVYYASAEARPTAAQMAGGGVYTLIGTSALTTSGSPIEDALPDGIEPGTYKLAALVEGGGDADVKEILIEDIVDTTVAASGVTPVWIAGDNSASSTASSTETLTINMSTHTATEQVIVAFGVFGNASGATLSSVVFDGKSPTATAYLPTASTDGVGAGYAVFAPASFAASSSLVFTFSGGVYDVGAGVYNVPPGKAVSTLNGTQAETTRAGSTLSGNVAAGDGVIAVQQVKNGVAGNWTGVSPDYIADIRLNEHIDIGSAGDVVAATPRVITITGNSVLTSAISIKVAV